MLRNGIQPWHVLVLVVVILLVFGAKRLPDIAKSVGQSMKIFKAEVKDLRDDDQPAAPPAATSATPGTSTGTPTGAPAPTVADEVAEPRDTRANEGGQPPVA